MASGNERAYRVPKFPVGRRVSTTGHEPSGMAAAAAIAEHAAQEIISKFGNLGPRERRKLVSRFRRHLFPASGRPGRGRSKRSKEITAACLDWKAGMRGLPLYRKHIPRFDRMGYWEQKVKMRTLMDAIRTRNRRERPQPPATELITCRHDG